MVEIASFVLDVVKCLAAPIGRPFMYLYNYKKNIDNLQDEVTNLKNTSEQVQVKVTAAEINVEEIIQSVNDWQTDVEKAITEAEQLIEEKENNPRCFKGLCPNLITRNKLSRKAVGLKRDDIGPLLLQAEKFDSVSYPSIPPEKNFDKLQDDLLKLKNARLKVQRKVEEAKNNEEEIEEDVKKWLEDVDSIIVKAEELIQNQSSIGTDRKTGYQYSKAASEIMADDIGPLLRQEERFDKVSYSTIQLSNYGKNFDKLGDDVSKLKNARLKVQRKIEEAKNNVEEIEEDVKKWLEDVDSIIVKADNLIENQSSIGTDCKTRCQNSKAASELMVDDIGPLLLQEERFDKVSHPTIHKEIWLRSNEDYLAFESRESTETNVWEALKDEKIYMIGVYGMGGLGKTTLVQEIGRKAEKDKLFDDEIVFVEVTETPDTKKIQTAIGKKLGLKFEDEKEDESERASKLYSRMMEKNILLTLDNIWKELDLKKVGIPSKADRGRNKILMTTRNVDVLERMGSENNFNMGILNEEEAWDLFKKMAGDVIQTRELNSLPNDVCKECRGLPIVICTIAKALRNKKQPFDWNVALQELRAPSPTKFRGLLEEEYHKIALSYKLLKDDELKKTFLICSLMGNNTSISYLFKHVVGLDILEGANLTMEDARDRLDKLVRELKDSCLLLDGFKSRQFAMHDVIRVVAVTIAYTDHHVFTLRNDIEREWKNKDKVKKCTKISLTGNSTVISELWPKDLDCPNLEYFYMTHMRGSSYEIFEDFFTVTPELKVLDLYGMRQSSLPSSLHHLTNLQTLCLDDCKIEDVAIIGKLKTLKVLSLRHSNIEKLPIEFDQLIELRLLDLSNCWQLKVIVPSVISKLSQLEELYITGFHIEWEVEVLEELKGLSQLTSLILDVRNDIVLPQGFFSRKLKRYKISIGSEWFHYYNQHNYEFSRMCEFKYGSTISLEEFQIFKNVELLWLAKISDADNNLTPLFNEKVIFTNLMVLKLKDISFGKIWDSKLPTLMSSSYENLMHLTLHRCSRIKYAFSFCIAKSFKSLQHLEIKDCYGLEQIVAEEGAEPVVNLSFPQVTFLALENLPNLTAFCHGIDTWELPMLKRLVVKECGKFTSKYLSFHEISLHISEPKSLWLDNKINDDLEEFELMDGRKKFEWKSQSKTLKIEWDKSANIPLGLLQRYKNMKELKLSACNQYKELFFPNLEVPDINMCSKLTSRVASSASFRNLKVLRVDYCCGLMKLITPSTARSLEQLREMSIESCEMLIEIVENEGDTTTSTEIVFDNLKTLSLRYLESLLCFCSGNYSFKFPSLEEINIGECPNMKIFSQGILSTPKLYKVNYERWNENKNEWEKIMEVENEVNDLNKTIQGAYKKQDVFVDLKYEALVGINSTEICYNQRPNSFYQNLTHLFLWNCDKIKYAFPSFIAKSFHQLQQLKIQNCKLLEEIVAKDEGLNAIVNFDFPNVTLLKLEGLPELKAFYPEVHTSKWPILKELVVTNCDKFTSKHMSFQENSEEGGLHISKPKSLFLDDKINHDLEVFELRNDLKVIIWQSQSRVFEIEYDDSTNIPFGLLQRFENMKELKLSSSHEYKEKELLFPNLPNLEVLEVQFCNNLMSLMVFATSFQNLKVLGVYSCHGLMKLITPSIARSLVQLREMNIVGCTMLIEIVENEGERDATTSIGIVFDNLKTLSLRNLKSLICFCSGNYFFNFPSLEELNIEKCPNMKIFSQGILNTPKLHEVNYKSWKMMGRDADKMEVENDLDTTIQQAHKKQVDSNLKELTLSGRDVMSIWKGEFEESFGKVKTLQLIKNDYANIPIQILHKFNSLEKLIVKASSYEEIFSCGEDEEHVETLTKLKDLELWGLFNLTCIWKQDSRSNSILQNLDRLVVHYCHNLTTLLPSFENLRTLTVSYCNEMKNLMSSSIAKGLVPLEDLSIEHCKMMIEVLANEGDIEKGEIAFEKLKKLRLCDLECLTCFCYGDHTLKFINLEELYVWGCSKTRTFSGGDLNMPRLKNLNFKSCSKSDIDVIIQQLQNDCSTFCERLLRGGDIHPPTQQNYVDRAKAVEILV